MGMWNIVVPCALAPALVGAGGLDAAADPFRVAAEPLPVEEAFVFTSWLEGERLVAHWDMPKGYYLYRHRLEVRAGEGLALGAPAIPRGERKTDEYFGESEVHYGSVEIKVPVLERPAIVAVRITYQGCADTGFCYPPQVRKVVHEASGRAAFDKGERGSSAGGTTAARAPAKSSSAATAGAQPSAADATPG